MIKFVYNINDANRQKRKIYSSLQYFNNQSFHSLIFDIIINRWCLKMVKFLRHTFFPTHTRMIATDVQRVSKHCKLRSASLV